MNSAATFRNIDANPRRRAEAADLLIRDGRGLVNRDALSAFATAARERADREEREAAELAARERADREAAAKAAWLSGESSYQVGRLSDDNGGALIRARGVERDESGAITGGELQTSWGASVPLAHALRAFRFLKLCHDTGRTWNANGRTIPVGHFRVSEVRPDGFTAGCHTFNWPEIARLASALGVAEMAGDESALVNSAMAA